MNEKGKEVKRNKEKVKKKSENFFIALALTSTSS
jgi:hypothetical protein